MFGEMNASVQMSLASLKMEMFICPQDTMPSKQTIVIADTFMSGAE